MTDTAQITRATHLRDLFLQLHSIMSAEGERNWIRGISHIIAVLGEVEGNPSAAADRIAEARQSFRSLHAGNGGFWDFHVWREDFDERFKANTELSKITQAISRDFESDG